MCARGGGIGDGGGGGCSYGGGGKNCKTVKLIYYRLMTYNTEVSFITVMQMSNISYIKYIIHMWQSSLNCKLHFLWHTL